MTSTERETYNGWTNYETWSIALYMGNDAGSAGYWEEAAEEAWDNPARSTLGGIWSDRDGAVFALADRMKDEHEEGNPLADDNSVFGQLLSAALSEVNWREIAEHYIDDHVSENDIKLDDDGNEITDDSDDDSPSWSSVETSVD